MQQAGVEHRQAQEGPQGEGGEGEGVSTSGQAAGGQGVIVGNIIYFKHILFLFKIIFL